MSNENPLAVSTKRAASLLDKSPHTLETWRRLGIGPRFVQEGRRILYPLREIHAWMDEHLVEPSSTESDRG